MTPSTTTNSLAGAWHGRLTFTEGPRRGEHEPVRLSFLPEGVIIHADENPVGGGQLARGIGEWTASCSPRIAPMSPRLGWEAA